MTKRNTMVCFIGNNERKASPRSIKTQWLAACAEAIESKSVIYELSTKSQFIPYYAK